MFSQEFNGYKKSEVDAFIQRMRASYEARLMEEKLKALDSEKKVLDLKNERNEIENKERNIMTALNVIEKAKHFQEDGAKNFYKLLMQKVELLLTELDLKFPQLKKDKDYNDLMDEIFEMLDSYKSQLDKPTDITHPIYSENDSMRMLLNKMQDYKKVQESPKEVRIVINKKVPDVRTVPDEESGFDFDEALHPTEDLAEIMKAFDFYNNKGEKR